MPANREGAQLSSLFLKWIFVFPTDQVPRRSSRLLLHCCDGGHRCRRRLRLLSQLALQDGTMPDQFISETAILETVDTNAAGPPQCSLCNTNPPHSSPCCNMRTKRP